MTDEAMTEYELKFKVFKGHLRVDWARGDEGGRIKLSYPQWRELTDAKRPSKRWPHWDRGKLMPAEWLVVRGDYGSEAKLQEYGLTERKPYRDKWKRDVEQRGVLTELGEIVFRAMPKCPAMKDWPERKREAKREAKRAAKHKPKLTPYQQSLLTKWPVKRRSLAIPVGETAPEEARWWAADGHDMRSLAALLREGMVEPGVSGVTFADGKLAVDGHVALVYRRTVLGALTAQD